MSGDASDPARYFGREVRRARLAARMSLADLGRVVGYHASQVSRVERGVRTPTEKFAQGCDRAFPGRGGWFSASTGKAGGGPRPRHGSATGSRSTSGARSACGSGSRRRCPGCCKPRRSRSRCCGRSPARHRADRRATVRADGPPGDSHPREARRRPWCGSWSMRPRFAGAPEARWSWLISLTACSALAELPNVTIQVVPNVGHAGLTGGFAIAEKAKGSAAYIETALGGQVFEDAQAVRDLSARFDALRTEALRGTESLRLIEEVASEWRRQATGASPATQARTAASA